MNDDLKTELVSRLKLNVIDPYEQAVLESTLDSTQLENLNQNLNDVLEYAIELAYDSVVKRRFPFNEKKVLEEKYHSTVINIATFIYNKRGAEGQISHTEGDIRRTFESGGIPESMLSDIIPYVGVV